MSKELTQLNPKQMIRKVEEFLSTNKDYRVIFMDFMVPGLVGGYTKEAYEVDKFLSQHLEGYYNQRNQYLDIIDRIVQGEARNSRIIKEEGLDIDSLIDHEQIIDEVETIKVGNGFLEDGQFKYQSEGVYIHRIKTKYYHQLETRHLATESMWMELLDYMTQGNREDQERLQKFLGSIFLIKNQERKAFSQFGLFGGASGSGKSTLFKLVSKALGQDKTVDLQLEEFTDDNKLKEANNKLFIIDHELDIPIKGKRASLIKQGAEGGEFLINSKYIEAYPITLTGTIALATNKDYDYIVPFEERNGLDRRLQSFWFDYSLPREMTQIVDFLLNDESEETNEVILNWLVKGYMALSGHHYQIEDEQEVNLPIGMDLAKVQFPNSDWNTFSIYWGLVKTRRRVDGERIWVIEKDPRGKFTDYITYGEVIDEPVEEVIDLLHQRGWDEGKKFINQRIVHHFNLEIQRVRREGQRVRIYSQLVKEEDNTIEEDLDLDLGF